jgi:hypothetical protein
MSGSTIYTLMEQLELPIVADYLVVNLGDGRNWLTSRLYLFARLLHEKGVRSFVFVESMCGVTGRFVGTADLKALWRSLGRSFDWLESAFDGSQSWPGGVQHCLVAYLVAVQGDTPGVDGDDWVFLESGNKWEHARWVDTLRLRELLGEGLSSARVVCAEELSQTDQIRRVLAKEGPLVALVDDDRRLQTVVDRFRLAETVARRAASAAS